MRKQQILVGIFIQSCSLLTVLFVSSPHLLAAQAPAEVSNPSVTCENNIRVPSSHTILWQPSTPKWLTAQPYVLTQAQVRLQVDQQARLSLHDINGSAMRSQLHAALGLGAGFQIETQTQWQQNNIIAPIALREQALAIRLRLGPETIHQQPSIKVGYRQQNQRAPQLCAALLYAQQLTRHLHAMAGFDYTRNLRGIYHLQMYQLKTGISMHGWGQSVFPIAYAFEAEVSFREHDSVPRTRTDIQFALGPSIVWPLTSKLHLLFSIRIRSDRRTEQDVLLSQYAIVPHLQMQWLSTSTSQQ